MFRGFNDRKKLMPPWAAYAPVLGVEPFVRWFRGRTWWFDGARWVVVPPDPYFANVTLMVRANRLWGSLSESPGRRRRLFDSSVRANHAALWTGTVDGGASSSLELPSGPYNGASMWFNQSASAPVGWYAPMDTTGLRFGTGDFTYEGWFYQTGATGYHQLLDFRSGNVAQNASVLLLNNTTNKPQFMHNASTFDITGTNAMTQNAWHHLHVTRASGTTYLGMDGVQEGADYTDSTNYNVAGLCWIGLCASTSNIQALIGYWSEVRVTNGVARYARTYTVPTMPFPDY